MKLIHVNSYQPMDRSDKNKFYIWYGNFFAHFMFFISMNFKNSFIGYPIKPTFFYSFIGYPIKL